MSFFQENIAKVRLLIQQMIGLTDDVSDVLAKENPLGSSDFIKLAIKVMNFSDIAGSLERLNQEERKEAEFEWIWKEKKVALP